MNRQQQARVSQRRKQGRRTGSADIWRTPNPMPELEPIATPNDPSAMVRSLGDPPMNGGPAAGHYFATVVERAAGIARALAMSVELLPPPDAD